MAIDWTSTPRARRKRGELSITIAPETREALDEMAGPGARSALVERLILDEKERRAKSTER
jgi:hypothetical protein